MVVVVSAKAKQPRHGLDGGADLLGLLAGDSKLQGLLQGMDTAGEDFGSIDRFKGGQDRLYACSDDPLALRFT